MSQCEWNQKYAREKSHIGMYHDRHLSISWVMEKEVQRSDLSTVEVNEAENKKKIKKTIEIQNERV